MTDALDRLSTIGADLLLRVDAVLDAGGVPPDHPVWPLLHRVGARPSEILEYAQQLDPQALRDSAAELRATARRFAELPRQLTGDIAQTAWEGAAADAFATTWASLSAHLGDTNVPASLSGRLESTAAYADAMADWAATFRHEIAEAVARTATSAEAVTLLTAASTPAFAGPASSGVAAPASSGVAAPASRAVTIAAAWIANRILQSAADGLDSAVALQTGWGGALSELDYRAPSVAGSGLGASGVTRVDL